MSDDYTPVDSYEQLLSLVADGTRFSWSRWGDGEWNAVLRTRGPRECNCDGQMFRPALHRRLKAVLEAQPEYAISIQPLAASLFQDNSEFKRLKAKNVWCRGAGFHYASAQGRLPLLVEQLKKRHTVLVANRHLAPLPFNAHVKIPDHNAWDRYESIKSKIIEQVKEDSVVIYCAGMTTNALIHELYGRPITQLDLGSVFDPYVGRKTRKYHYKMDNPTLDLDSKG